MEQCNDGDDELDCVTESGVDESSQGLTDTKGDLFGTVAEQLRERHDAQEGRDQDGNIVLGVGLALRARLSSAAIESKVKGPRYRNANEQDVERRGEDNVLERLEAVGCILETVFRDEEIVERPIHASETANFSEHDGFERPA